MLRKKILVVDDDPAIVDALSAMLGAGGYNVVSAGDGEEAIVKAAAEKPHLILMDVMLPKLSGYECMTRIRKDPSTKDIPAIILSGKKGWEMFFDGISRIELMYKPVEGRALLDKIEHLIGKCQRHLDEPKRAVLCGVEDLLDNKVQELLTRFDFQVFKALNEREVILLAEKHLPDMIFCQYWEDKTVLDCQKVSEKVLAHPDISGTPLYVFCLRAHWTEAVKWFREDQILFYDRTSELLRKLEKLLRKTYI